MSRRRKKEKLKQNRKEVEKLREKDEDEEDSKKNHLKRKQIIRGKSKNNGEFAQNKKVIKE